MVKLKLGLVPEADVSGAVLLQDEVSTFLTFNAVRQNTDGSRGETGTAILTFKVCTLTKFGYPNDEALGGHPLYKRGLKFYEIHEVKHSTWVKEKTEQNRVSFPQTPDSDARHFIITFHDSTFECIAMDVEASLDTRPFEQILVELSGKLTNN